jgi:hypothetical protein
VEFTSNGAFLYSYGNFFEHAPLGQVVNIVDNQDVLDQNGRNPGSGSGGGAKNVPGSNDNSVQVRLIT